MTIYEVLELIKAKTQDERTKGAVFEKLIQRWMMVDAFYAAHYDKVWLWNEFPAHKEMGNVDLGIDLVAHLRDGGYAAIQCKFYSEDTVIGKPAVDSFISQSGRSFHDPIEDPEGKGEPIRFAERVWVSTTENYGKNAKQALQGQTPNVVEVYLKNLDESDVDWERIVNPDKPAVPKPKPQPRDYQEVIIQAAVRHYDAKQSERGLLVMACGTGKTLTSLFIAQRLAALTAAEDQAEGRVMEDGRPRAQTVLFLAPSIALVSQSMRSWVASATEPIGAMCVCSDVKAGSTTDPTAKEDNDSMHESLLDLPVASCTDPKIIAREVKRLGKLHGMVVIFSTYQSIDVVHNAMQQAEGGKMRFDLVICDEAHRTANVIMKGREKIDDQSDFTKVHDDSYIPARRRMYMTATPRIYREGDKNKAKLNDDLLMSMDDEKVYGQCFYTLSFGTAVEKGLLTDYKVMVLTIDPQQLMSHELLNAIKEHIPGSEDSTNAKKEANEYGSDAEEAEDRRRAEALSQGVAHVTPEMTAMMLGSLAALSKQVTANTADPFADQTEEERKEPLHTCIAFCDNVHRTTKTRAGRYVASETAQMFGHIAETYRRRLYDKGKLDDEAEDYIKRLATTKTSDVSGEMDTNTRNTNLTILRRPEQGETHIVCNVNCLSEGVDVPALDSIVFLAAKSSPITLIQSVGRVMRRFEGKKYGYVIIPIVVPMGVSAEAALDKNERFKIVWDVLNALRSHDERLAAELSNHTYRHVIVVKPKPSPNPNPGPNPKPKPGPGPDPVIPTIPLVFEDKLYARMVEKVGDRFYWANWSKKVGQVAHNFIARITELIQNGHYRDEMDLLVRQLRQCVNSSISYDDAITFLAQHLVTRPVFDALFADYHMEDNNPVSLAMGQMVNLLEGEAFVDDRRVLDEFCDNVRQVCGSLDDLGKKQDMIRTLYEQFFKNAFPKTTEQLGIVYTPVECVDFIIRSVDEILERDFGKAKGLATDEPLRCIDPFAGTGTFTVRALQWLRHGRRAKMETIREKYKHDFLAMEIVLLSYYIADVNIENAYNALARQEWQARQPKTREGQEEQKEKDSKRGKTPTPPPAYERYDGICLADTFAITENRGTLPLPGLLAENTRAAEEAVTPDAKRPLTVIWGNPPYSAGQKSANDNAQNLKYEQLDARIAETYAAAANSQNKNSLYDTYIKAFRWATDRIAEQGDRGGIVAFISNAGWIDGNSQDGMRRCLEAEWSDIYIYHLKGNQRTSGELSRREGGKIFGQGSRTPIAITILVRRPGALPAGNRATIHMAEVEDYLSREQKLKALTTTASVLSADYQAAARVITPNAKGDWINQRDGEFEKLIVLGDKDDKENEKTVFLPVYCRGVGTSRDAWAYNFSRESMLENMQRSNSFYEEQRIAFQEARGKGSQEKVEDFICTDPTKISWSRAYRDDIAKNKEHKFDRRFAAYGLYRPFCIQNIYFDRVALNDVAGIYNMFPTPRHANLVICISGKGGNKDFTCLISNVIPDLNCMDAGAQCYPLYHYESYSAEAGGKGKKGKGGEEKQQQLPGLEDAATAGAVSAEALRELGYDAEGFRRRSAISPWAVDEACRRMKVTRHQMAEARLSMGRQEELLSVTDAKGDHSVRHLTEEEEADLCAEAIFFYTFGALHSPGWRRRFSADLKKEAARIGLTADPALFRRTAMRGEAMARLQLWAATGEGDVKDLLPEAPEGMTLLVDGQPAELPLPAAAMRVSKMRFPSKTDKSTIWITDCVCLTGIPAEAYRYVVNGKSALEWVMERVAVTQDKFSRIVNDPNAWAAEHGQPDWAARLVWRVALASIAMTRMVEEMEQDELIN